jgi:hypothetical protein
MYDSCAFAEMRLSLDIMKLDEVETTPPFGANFIPNSHLVDSPKISPNVIVLDTRRG